MITPERTQSCVLLHKAESTKLPWDCQGVSPDDILVFQRLRLHPAHSATMFSLACGQHHRAVHIMSQTPIHDFPTVGHPDSATS